MTLLTALLRTLAQGTQSRPEEIEQLRTKTAFTLPGGLDAPRLRAASAGRGAQFGAGVPIGLSSNAEAWGIVVDV